MRRIGLLNLFFAVTLTVGFTAGVAHAVPTKCKAAIGKSAAAFAQAKIKVLQKCEENRFKGKVLVACPDTKTQAKIDKAESKAKAGIVKACGGKDKACGVPKDADDDTLASIGWDTVPTCPDFEARGCTNPIANCNDIGTCLTCMGEAAVDQSIDLSYASLKPSNPKTQKALNKCQLAIGKAAAAFFGAKSKTLQKCWDTVNKKSLLVPCPPFGAGDGKAGAAITKASDKFEAVVCKACGGTDKLCGGGDDLSPIDDIGAFGQCPPVTIPNGGTACGGAITTLQDLVDCLDCVNEFKVDCLTAAQSTGFPNAPVYPAECASPLPPTPTPTTSPTPTATTTPIATATTTATATATVTATAGAPTATVTKTATPTVTSTPAGPTITSTPAGPTATLTSTPGGPTATVTPTVAGPTPTITATPSGTCGNGVLDTGEDCDLSAGVTCASGPFNTDPAFTCSGTCQCACPGFVEFAGTPPGACNAGANFNRNCSAASECPGGSCVPGLSGVLDTGWTGQGHDSPIVDQGKLTVAVTTCAGSSRPCGVCNLLGPVDNLNAATYPSASGPSKDINNRRCTNAPEVLCSNNTPCFQQCLGGTNDGLACTGTNKCVGGSNANFVCTVASQCPGGTCSAQCPGTGTACTNGAGTCEYFFGTLLPLAAGGVATCIGNTVVGTITGTANVETGSSASTVVLRSIVYSSGDLASPCSHCTGDTNPNDGARDGTCTSGPRSGKVCDVNGTSPNAAWGTTSLDCPPLPGAQIAALPIDLTNTTGTKTKTITASNPLCRSGPAGSRCQCDTCNTAGVVPCSANADCPDPPGPIGPICGGKRCGSGGNVGAACTANSECPGGACTVPGQATEPNVCDDDTCSPDPGTPSANDRTCLGGPFDTFCSPVETFRGCLANSDCPRPGDTCTGGKNRDCFDNGALTDVVTASGVVDPPSHDTSDPTLAALFCVGNTSSTGVNTAAGLPGLGRIELPGHATGLP